MADANSEFNQAVKLDTTAKLLLLLVNTAILAVGTAGGPLLMRLYFLHGGKRVWFSSWLETAGWPIILIPLAVAYYQRRHRTTPAELELIIMKPRLFLGAALVGVLTGVDDYLYAYGVARLPVSTSSLIIASQLAFTAGFAFLLVKQRFTPFSLNAVFLLTVGAGVLALHTSSDRPKGETKKEYLMGFVMTIAAAALYGFVLPLVEWTYAKGKQKVTYTLVLEYQMVMCFFATLVCTIGMIANNDFKVIGREAREYGLGEAKYYFLVVISGIVWQGFFLGAIGVIFCSSSLFSGVIISVLLPVTEVLAVIFFKESFTGEKGVSLALSLWGFGSYYYGELKAYKKTKQQKKLLKISSTDATTHDDHDQNKNSSTEMMSGSTLV